MMVVLGGSNQTESDRVFSEISLVGGSSGRGQAEFNTPIVTTLK